MKLIPDWNRKNLICYFCGETKSVKYEKEIIDPEMNDKSMKVCVCNKCALRYNNKAIKE